MKVARVEEMRTLDRRATEEFGIAQDLLMENAGQAVYFVMLQELGIRDRKFVVSDCRQKQPCRFTSYTQRCAQHLICHFCATGTMSSMRGYTTGT